MAIAPAQFNAAPFNLAPFDAIAERYDETFTCSKIGRAQRASVWNKFETTFRPGDRVLEIGCGTGVDACFLADRGVKVVACDNSPQMIKVATRRVAEAEKRHLVQTYLLAAEDIATLRSGETFDGAFSNFGALNCVQDLPQLARNLAALLKPSATALLCWMGSYCLWEVIWYFGRGDPQKAFRRFRRGGVTARLAEGTSIRVHYPSVRSLVRTFSPEFQLESIKGIGVSVPPSYLEPWANQFPRLFGLSVRADLVLGHCSGFRSLADHVLLEFRRKDLRDCR
jgi:ubiquinone/menaquinone biosynthesis C-methylase UbiE